jgi:hypothetical protein
MEGRRKHFFFALTENLRVWKWKQHPSELCWIATLSRSFRNATRRGNLICPISGFTSGQLGRLPSGPVQADGDRTVVSRTGVCAEDEGPYPKFDALNFQMRGAVVPDRNGQESHRARACEEQLEASTASTGAHSR